MLMMSSLAWKRTALVCGATLFCMASLELGLRVVSPVKTFVNPLGAFHQSDAELGWSGLPDLAARFRKVDFDVVVRHNPRGFREKSAAVQPKTGSPLLVVLGDSFTWGWGVNNGRVFTDVMQNQLPEFNVANLGVNGYGTVQEFLLLKNCLKNGLRPRHVVVMVFNNDFYDNIDASGGRPWLAVQGTNITLQNYPVRKRVISPFKRFTRQSYLASAIAYFADFWKERRRIEQLERSVFQEGAMTAAPERAMDYVLGQFRQLCQQEGMGLLVGYVPAAGDIKLDAPSPARSVLTELCQKHGVPLLDLTPGFRKAGTDALARYYFPHDEHWNEQGHALAGTLLADFIKDAWDWGHPLGFQEATMR